MVEAKHYKTVNGVIIPIESLNIDCIKFDIELDSDGECEYTFYYRNGNLVYYTERRYY